MNNTTDWKDALAALGGIPAPEQDATPDADIHDDVAPEKRQKGTLHVVIEKKGRGGKTATIVEGFEIDDEAIDDIARDLRRRLGTGGSSRGGEILIQGDRKSDVVRLLREMGFKAN